MATLTKQAMEKLIIFKSIIFYSFSNLSFCFQFFSVNWLQCTAAPVWIISPPCLMFCIKVMWIRQASIGCHGQQLQIGSAPVLINSPHRAKFPIMHSDHKLNVNIPWPCTADKPVGGSFRSGSSFSADPSCWNTFYIKFQNILD